MATATATPPSSTSTASPVVESIVAAYKTHAEAEAAVRKLEKGGVPIEHVSIIGRDFKVREEIEGYYRPSDAAKEGAGFGALVWRTLRAAHGLWFFRLPIWSADCAWTLGGNDRGSRDWCRHRRFGQRAHSHRPFRKMKRSSIKSRVEAGEFLVTVMGPQDENARARSILENTGQVDLNQF
jgi:hypothetical protein